MKSFPPTPPACPNRTRCFILAANRRARRAASIRIRFTTTSPTSAARRRITWFISKTNTSKSASRRKSAASFSSALDKSDNYDFIYRQHVIKPSLIGLIGAWISGGIEWNIPHHHRASTFLPVQYRTESNADGSKTIWVGELEVRQRMRWAVGYTLRPGSSVLECSVRIINRTPLPNSMLCFANVAVSVNDNYQVIFPPEHAVRDLPRQTRFRRVADRHRNYNGADFGAGTRRELV